MNQTEGLIWTSSTSAVGSMSCIQISIQGAFGRIPLVEGTSSGILQAHLVDLYPATNQTNTGIRVLNLESPNEGIIELKRLTGLTWAHLARLFGVDRRSVHFWSNGHNMTAENEQKLELFLDLLRKIDRGSMAVNRRLILRNMENGWSLYRLLEKGKFEEVSKIISNGFHSIPTVPVALSAEARKRRTPRPPEEFVGALHDSVHIEKERIHAAKPIKSKKRS